MKLGEVLLLAGAVVLVVAAWPLLFVLSWFARPPRKPLVRVGKELKGVTLSEARVFDPVWWLEVPGLQGHLHTLAVLFKRPQLPDVVRWWDKRSRVRRVCVACLFSTPLPLAAGV